MRYFLLILFSVYASGSYAQMDTIKSGNLTIIQDTAVTKILNIKVNPLKARTIHGFRVQLTSSANRNEINSLKSEFMKAHPDVRTYMTYQQPYFKLRVGDFEERTDANRFMNEIYSQFPGFIVEDVINTEENNTSSQNKPQQKQ